jgi:hypothetical protein
MEDQMRDDFAHIVMIDQSTRTLKIERLYPDGRRELFTAKTIPTPTDRAMVAKFARELGENLLLDSRAALQLLSL